MKGFHSAVKQICEFKLFISGLFDEPVAEALQLVMCPILLLYKLTNPQVNYRLV